jgi:hypothetical protein
MALKYYNYDKLYSFNATYNFVIGGRGLGKTYGAKKKAIRAALQRGDQFIYLRRYKEELKASKATFFADIEHEFPEWDFKIIGGNAVASHVSSRNEPKRKWAIIGFFISLSTSQMQKSVAFPKVKTIIYDEFIIEKGALHYLPQEDIVFNNFYSTVDRYKDKTRVLFLANSVSIMNPYFLAYGIVPTKDDEFIVKYDGFVCAHFPNAEEFQSGVYETRFGRFIQGTEYAEYAVANSFSDNNDSLLKLKDGNARYIFTLECKTGMFSVWHNVRKDEYFVQEALPKDQVIFTLLSERMDTNKVLMTFTDRPLAYLRSAFRGGRVVFDKPKTRNTFTEIFKR